MKESRITVGETIRELRKTLGLTQDEFGARIDMSQEGVANLESDKHKPSYDTIRKLIDVFKVSSKLFFPD